MIRNEIRMNFLSSIIFLPIIVSTCKTYAARGFPHEMIKLIKSLDDFGSDK